MKFGIQKPSLKKRISARTSWKRYVRHNRGLKAPKGWGILTNPKKAMYNKVYNKTSVSVDDLIKKPNKPSNKPADNKGETSLNLEIDNLGKIIRSSSKALEVTSENFEDLRRKITDIYERRIELLRNLKRSKALLILLTAIHYLSYPLIIGFFYKGLADIRENKKEEVKQLKELLAQNFIKLTFADKSQFEKSWLNLLDAFQDLMRSNKIWDVTYSKKIDGIKERTLASSAIKRTPIKLKTKKLDFIKSDLEPLFLPNANGPDIFIYTTFLLLFKDKERFGIFDLKQVNTTLRFTAYVEEQSVPSDSEIIQHTWKKTNKDGSRDKRFKDNCQIPVVKYGSLEFYTENGLEEYFMFSNADSFETFARTYEYHCELLNTENITNNTQKIADNTV